MKVRCSISHNYNQKGTEITWYQNWPINY
jgi:hypothetical protein